MKSKETRALVIAALGIVFGDIGTSPLYALKECFIGPHAVAPTPENILGVLSLVIWSLLLVVTFKYLFLVMRAHNNGEGGMMALLAILSSSKLESAWRGPWRNVLILLGLFGGALLYGDGIITPAISVLSAVEGLEVATPVFRDSIVPITVGILVVFFYMQHKGTARIGAVFGPTIMVWFAALAVLAIPWILKEPRVLAAFSPVYAVEFFVHNGLHGAVLLGSVVLCITGAEALYADMGHFGVRPIRIGWLGIVLPCLLLNYLGQGALFLDRGAEVTNPFYEIVPTMLLYPMVALATAAAIIASQAMISGAFSLTAQAQQLGYLPRMGIVHTSEQTEGQIYIPRINQLMALGCLLLVVAAGNSSDLAGAYGIAVTGAFAITTLLFCAIARYLWGWSWLPVLLLGAVFLVIDLAFFGANIIKVAQGGWFPLMVGLLVFTVMTTWRRGRQIVMRSMFSRAMTVSELLEKIERDRPHRVRGTAVFMTPNLNIAPRVLLHHLRHNQVLHERVILLTVVTKHVPTVRLEEHGRMTDLGQGVVQIIAKYGYLQRPNITEILNSSQVPDLDPTRPDVSFYLGHETLLTTGPAKMARWRKKLFSFLSRNAQPATAFFEIPPDRVIEVGLQLEV